MSKEDIEGLIDGLVETSGEPEWNPDLDDEVPQERSESEKPASASPVEVPAELMWRASAASSPVSAAPAPAVANLPVPAEYLEPDCGLDLGVALRFPWLTSWHRSLLRSLPL